MCRPQIARPLHRPGIVGQNKQSTSPPSRQRTRVKISLVNGFPYPLGCRLPNSGPTINDLRDRCWRDATELRNIRNCCHGREGQFSGDRKTERGNTIQHETFYITPPSSQEPNGKYFSHRPRKKPCMPQKAFLAAIRAQQALRKRIGREIIS